MQFLKILFWALLAFLAAIFTVGNWTTVPIKLWGGLIAEVNLPLLLLVVFLIGLIPMLMIHHTVRWRLRQRLATAQNALETVRGLSLVKAPVLDPDPVTPPTSIPPTSIPPASIPSAVPPGGA